MVENGLYIIKEDYFKLVKTLGGSIADPEAHKRPTFCCFKDNRVDGLYWAIPTSDIEHRSEDQIKKYTDFMKLPEKDLRSSYYHIARTTKRALYKVSSCFPITDKYIDHEFMTMGKHVIMKSNKDIAELNRKLKKILAFEFRKKDYFHQKISSIRSYLIEELSNN